MSDPLVLSCPTPYRDAERVLLAHGGGGREMRRLVDEMLLPAFAQGCPQSHGDSAIVEVGAARLAFTTDSYVVRPRFFPGGDLGELAVYGTVNDLAVAGAIPRFLSLALVCEEGFEQAELQRIVTSVARAAQDCGVRVVTGDTKVVERGAADGLYINTSGLGEMRLGVRLGAEQVKAGDQIVVSGDLGRHGVAVLLAREGLGLHADLSSDCAPLHTLTRAMLEVGGVRVMRDLTRGGLAAALCELALESQADFVLDEDRLVVHDAVRAVSELLGLDPLVMANEGRLVAVVAAECTAQVLEAMRAVGVGAAAVRVGEVRSLHRTGGSSPAGPATEEPLLPREAPLFPVRPEGRVWLRSPYGATRLLDYPRGELLPRIC